MIARQFRVELRRLLHRGSLKAFLVIGAMALVLTGIGTYLASGAQQRYTEYYDASGYETIEATFCPSALVTASLGDLAYECPESTPSVIPRGMEVVGTPAPYTPWNGSIAMFNVVFAVALWVLVAALVGEEFRHGTVETALVAEPRRVRLLTLRLAAVVSVAVLAWVVMSVGHLVAVAPSWWFHGIEDATVPVSLLLAAAGRGLLLTVLVALLSGSLAVVGRGALTSVGALVGLTVVTGAFFLVVRALVPVEFFTNAWALVTGGDGLRVYTVRNDYAPAEEMTRFGAGWPWAGAVTVVVTYTAIAVAAAYALFVRRDLR